MPPKAAAKKPSTASKTPAASQTYATKAPLPGTAKKAPVVTSQKKKRKPRKETWSTYIYKGNSSLSLAIFRVFLFALDLVSPSGVLRWKKTRFSGLMSICFLAIFDLSQFKVAIDLKHSWNKFSPFTLSSSSIFTQSEEQMLIA